MALIAYVAACIVQLHTQSCLRFTLLRRIHNEEKSLVCTSVSQCFVSLLFQLTIIANSAVVAAAAATAISAVDATYLLVQLNTICLYSVCIAAYI